MLGRLPLHAALEEPSRRYRRILYSSCIAGVIGALAGVALFLRPYFAAWPAWAASSLILITLLAALAARAGYERAGRLLLVGGATLELLLVNLASAPGASVDLFWLLLPTLQFLFPPAERRRAYSLSILALCGFLYFQISGDGGRGLLQTPSADEVRIARIVNSTVVATLLAIFVALAVYWNRRAERFLHLERRRSDGILSAILPARIAERLKQSRGPIAERVDNVAVLFADIVGFTPLAERTPPERLVAVLNQIFTAFDRMAREYGVEKIKTIGDCYMACAGATERSGLSASRIARFALALQHYIRSHFHGELQLRIGLHIGPVVAGVIGASRYSYDLWGDTVNIASRLESHGEADCIQASESFRQQCGADFVFEERGLVDLKGRGPLLCYWLRGVAAETLR